MTWVRLPETLIALISWYVHFYLLFCHFISGPNDPGAVRLFALPSEINFHPKCLSFLGLSFSQTQVLLKIHLLLESFYAFRLGHYRICHLMHKQRPVPTLSFAGHLNQSLLFASFRGRYVLQSCVCRPYYTHLTCKAFLRNRSIAKVLPSLL